jgi:hypothetical protein
MPLRSKAQVRKFEADPNLRHLVGKWQKESPVNIKALPERVVPKKRGVLSNSR